MVISGCRNHASWLAKVRNYWKVTKINKGTRRKQRKLESLIIVVKSSTSLVKAKVPAVGVVAPISSIG